MSYIVCPTCGYFIGQIIVEFEKKKKIINDDPKILNDNKGKKIALLIKEMNLPRYCCSMRVLSYLDHMDICS